MKFFLNKRFFLFSESAEEDENVSEKSTVALRYKNGNEDKSQSEGQYIASQQKQQGQPLEEEELKKAKMKNIGGFLSNSSLPPLAQVDFDPEAPSTPMHFRPSSHMTLLEKPEIDKKVKVSNMVFF